MNEYAGLIIVVGWVVLSAMWLCAWCVFAPGDPMDDRLLLVLFAAALWPLVATAFVVGSPIIAGCWLGLKLRRWYYGDYS